MLFPCHWGLIYSSILPSSGSIVPNKVFTRSKNSFLDYLAPTREMRIARVFRTTASNLINLSQSASQDLFQKFIKAYLNKQGLSEGREKVANRLFKTRNSDLYYRNFYKECYYFCR